MAALDRVAGRNVTGGVMFWAGIMGRVLVGPFRVPEGVKMTSAKYVELLTDHFLIRTS